MTTWAPIPKWEGFYEASDDGRVRSLQRVDRLGRTVHARILAQSISGVNGRMTVMLCRDGKQFRRKVHQLVLLAFVGAAPEGMVVLHGIGGPLDNRLSNLRYGTQSENITEAADAGTHVNSRKSTCPHGHPYSGSNLRERRRNGRVHRNCRACESRRVRTS